MSKLPTLSSEKDFKFLFRHARKLENDTFKLWTSENSLPRHRFVFSVSLSVDKRSSIRNKLKRRAREWVRNNVKSGTRHLDFLLSFKKEAARCSKSKFYEELEKIFKEHRD